MSVAVSSSTAAQPMVSVTDHAPSLVLEMYIAAIEPYMRKHNHSQGYVAPLDTVDLPMVDQDALNILSATITAYDQDIIIYKDLWAGEFAMDHIRTAKDALGVHKQMCFLRRLRACRHGPSSCASLTHIVENRPPSLVAHDLLLVVGTYLRKHNIRGKPLMPGFNSSGLSMVDQHALNFLLTIYQAFFKQLYQTKSDLSREFGMDHIQTDAHALALHDRLCYLRKLEKCCVEGAAKCPDIDAISPPLTIPAVTGVAAPPSLVPDTSSSVAAPQVDNSDLSILPPLGCEVRVVLDETYLVQINDKIANTLHAIQCLTVDMNSLADNDVNPQQALLCKMFTCLESLDTQSSFKKIDDIDWSRLL